MDEPRSLHPFQVPPQHLAHHLELMVDVTFADLESQFLLLPKGPGFVAYGDFQNAYEVLKRNTASFKDFSQATLWAALREDALTLAVVRTMLGLTPPEWADLARSDLGVNVPQGAARRLEHRCRVNRACFSDSSAVGNHETQARVEALIAVAVRYISQGAPEAAEDVVHRLAKVDTTDGLVSVRHVANHHVPYAMLLYERYLGRPFASHRDAVSELVGEVMELAIEERLVRAGISFRKTKRAERVPGYDQAPDFFVPDEFNPAVVIEAKITGDDGTARDKITRIVHLAEMRDERERRGLPRFEVVACIDGRGFGVRREDMRRMLLRTEGKVFTFASLDRLIEHTRLQDFLPRS